MQSRSRSVNRIASADEEAVVEDVVVGEGGALGKAGRAAGELDVDRIVELQLFGERGQALPLGFAGEPGRHRRTAPCRARARRRS